MWDAPYRAPLRTESLAKASRSIQRASVKCAAGSCLESYISHDALKESCSSIQLGLFKCLQQLQVQAPGDEPEGRACSGTEPSLGDTAAMFIQPLGSSMHWHYPVLGSAPQSHESLSRPQVIGQKLALSPLVGFVVKSRMLCSKAAGGRGPRQRMPASILAAAGVSEVSPEQQPEPAWEPLDDLCWRQSQAGAPDRSVPV